MPEYPEIILGAVYEVDCNSSYNKPDDWIGTCRVVKEIGTDNIFYVERISGLRAIHTFNEDVGGYQIGAGSQFHRTMRLIHVPDKNIEIKFSFDSLIGEQHE